MSALNDSFTLSSVSLRLGFGENQGWQMNAAALTALPTLQKQPALCEVYAEPDLTVASGFNTANSYKDDSLSLGILSFHKLCECGKKNEIQMVQLLGRT